MEAGSSMLMYLSLHSAAAGCSRLLRLYHVRAGRQCRGDSGTDIVILMFTCRLRWASNTRFARPVWLAPSLSGRHTSI